MLVLRQQPFVALQIQNFYQNILIYFKTIRNFSNSKLYLGKKKKKKEGQKKEKKKKKDINKTKTPGLILMWKQIP